MPTTSNDLSPRDLVIETVAKRATHTDLDQVTDTLSNWSTERIVTGEYHGRFLIELLQNARDALLESKPGTSAISSCGSRERTTVGLHPDRGRATQARDRCICDDHSDPAIVPNRSPALPLACAAVPALR
jgi:hypothetical protein